MYPCCLLCKHYTECREGKCPKFIPYCKWCSWWVDSEDVCGRFVLDKKRKEYFRRIIECPD